VFPSNLTDADKKAEIIPLGGLGEFGMNCLALRWEDAIIVIDAGLMFPKSELLGVDIVVPDISYLIENKAHVCAIILTHGRGSRFSRRRQGKRLGVGPEPLRPRNREISRRKDGFEHSARRPVAVCDIPQFSNSAKTRAPGKLMTKGDSAFSF
jgi:hypothetical protein